MTLTFIILAATMALFVSDRLPVDLVALSSLLAFLLTGILSPEEALAGFSAPIVLVLAGMFVIGEGLSVTGLAERFGLALLKVSGRSERGVLIACMAACAGISAFVSSTGAVAMLMPVVIMMARRVGASPSRLLMPLAFAALFGGMLTLIGTPPNLVVAAELSRSGAGSFRFFSFTGPGLIILAGGITLVALLGPRVLTDRGAGSEGLRDVGQEGARSLPAAEIARTYGLPGNIFRLGVGLRSPLAGRRIGEAAIRSRYRVNVLELRDRSRPEEAAELAVGPGTEIPAGSLLIVRGKPDQVAEFALQEGLDILPGEAPPEKLMTRAVGLAEVLLAPRSSYIGQTLAGLRFRDRTGLHVIGATRLGQPLEGDIAATPLAFGDSLLVQGPWKSIALLRSQRGDVVLVEEPREFIEERQRASRARAPRAMVVLAAMLVLIVGGWIPLVATVLLTALALIVTRCLDSRQAYAAVNWQSLLLIAAMLPAAKALDKTGGLAIIVRGFVEVVGPLGPRTVLAGLFLLTSTMSLLMSNTATSVILAPVALQTAQGLEARPEAFLMTVALAASAAFATPMATPVNTLVFSAGGYRFIDYVKLGLPLQALVFVLTLLVVPLFFPL